MAQPPQTPKNSHLGRTRNADSCSSAVISAASHFGLRLKDSTFPDRFLASKRTGMYLRVLREGVVRANDEMTRESTGTISLVDAVDILHAEGIANERIAALAADGALSRRWREQAQKLLALRTAA